MTVYKWSQTPGTNSTVDATINWAEGMAPSAVNDSARAMMAAVARYRDDHSGVLVTTGSGSSYSVTTNQGFDSLAHLDGKSLVMQFHANNAAFAMLSVDGLAVKALRVFSGLSIPQNQIAAGVIYTVVYSNANNEFLIHGAGNGLLGAPSGTSMLFQQSTAPVLWTKQTLYNDFAIRVVSGGAGSGGAVPFTTLFQAAYNTNNYTLAVADMPSHVHSITDVQHAHNVTAVPGNTSVAAQAGAAVVSPQAATVIGTDSRFTGINSTNFQGGGGGHAHGIQLNVLYVDHIICNKD